MFEIARLRLGLGLLGALVLVGTASAAVPRSVQVVLPQSVSGGVRATFGGTVPSRLRGDRARLEQYRRGRWRILATVPVARNRFTLRWVAPAGTSSAWLRVQVLRGRTVVARSPSRRVAIAQATSSPPDLARPVAGTSVAPPLGDPPASSTPAELTPLTPPAPSHSWTAIEPSDGGSGGCGLRDDGQVMCWGFNSGGALGIGTLEESFAPYPIAVPGLTDAIAIAAASAHACALRAGGQVLCWGLDATIATNGTSTWPQSAPAPVAVPGLDDAVAISAGESSVCALRGNGEVRCWGSNYYGQLGDGTTPTPMTLWGPVTVAGLHDAVALRTSSFTSCAIRATRQAVCWGRNDAGQLGDGTTTNRATPVEVTGLTDAVAITPSSRGPSCAIRAGGQVVCWGTYGIPDGPDAGIAAGVLSSVPPALADAVAVDVDYNNGCAVLRTGEARCWGFNDRGQLGSGTRDYDLTLVPVAVLGLHDATDVSVGYKSACALRAAGLAACWGADRNGELGDGSRGVDRLAPVDVRP